LNPNFLQKPNEVEGAHSMKRYGVPFSRSCSIQCWAKGAAISVSALIWANFEDGSFQVECYDLIIFYKHRSAGSLRPFNIIPAL
jgi:hypothetical protein